MDTKMLTNNAIIKNNCDNKNIANDYSNSDPIKNITENMRISEENSNSLSSTTNTKAAAELESKAIRDHENNKMLNDRPHLEKTDSFAGDSSLTSYCSDEEDDIETAFEDESDQEEREQDNEIFYDSTNESEDNESKDANLYQNDEKTIKVCGATDCVNKSHMKDIEIDSKEEEQTIVELVHVAEKDKLMQVEENRSMRVAFGVILRLIFPLANGVVQGIKGIRDVRFLRVIRSIASSRQALTNLLAFAANTISLNLSSVQVSNRIEPILKLLKIRKSRDGIESLPDSPTLPHGSDAPSFPNSTTNTSFPFAHEPRYSLPNFQAGSKKFSLDEGEAPKCCTLNILAEPPEGQPIRADIVFIHGLHGSLVNTWKQGLWENERRPVVFERPPKPPVRPPKRPRHSRSSTVHPPHHKKRARLAHADVHQRQLHEKNSIDEGDENNFSFICGEPKDVQQCDDIDYSFPTFRLRLHDNGRLLQAEHDSKLPDDSNNQTYSDSPKGFNNSNEGKDQNKKLKPSKPSPNDPNYSKCWPGDWLPIDCPGVRVIALNYTTDQHLWRPLWKKKQARSNLTQRTREMTELLVKHRVGYGHPIVWVGHSKGGLFIKQIIVDAWESGRPATAPFWRSARGVFFYSVPHRGSHLASVKAPLLLRSVELIDIEKNSKYLLDLHRRFAGLYHLGHLKIEVFSFVETALTLMSVLYMRIVGVDSADPGIGDVCGIRLDHREICKPRSRDCILYKQLVNMINKVC